MSFAWLTLLRETLGRFKLKDYILGFLALGFVVSSVGWSLADGKADKYKAEVQTQMEGRTADAEKYRAAQAEYTEKALREKAEIERIDRERKEQADREYDTLLNEYRSTLRLRQYTPSTGGTDGRGDLSRPTTPPGVPIAGAPSPVVPPSEYLLISWDDADICAENTAKVLALYDFAKKE